MNYQDMQETKSKRIRLVAVILGVLAFTGHAEEAAEVFFRSNSLGMPLEEISKYRADEFEYVLSVVSSDGSTERRLFEEGVETKRWITVRTGRTRRDEAYEGDRPVSKEIYEDGRLVSEDLYKDGILEISCEYVYRAGILAKIIASDSAGKVYEDAYIRDGTGRLLRLVRTYETGARSVSGYTFSGVRLIGEWHGDEEDSSLFRFGPDGRNAEERWREGALLYRSEILSVDPKRSLETDFVTGAVVERTYDQDGHIVEEAGEGPEGSIKVRYEYEEGRQVAKILRSAGLMERWEYEYDGDDIHTERYYRDGKIVMVTVYTGENTYYEELYRDGRLFLKVYYQDEQRIREEFIPEFGRTSVFGANP